MYQFLLCFLSEKFYLPCALIFSLSNYWFQIFLNISSILHNLFFPKRLSFWWSPSFQAFKLLSSWDFINCFLNIVHYLLDIVFSFHDIILYSCVVHLQIRNATWDLNSWIIDSAYTVWVKNFSSKVFCSEFEDFFSIQHSWLKVQFQFYSLSFRDS